MQRRRFAMVVDGQLVGVVTAYGNKQAAEGLRRGVDLISFTQLRNSARLRPLFHQAQSTLAEGFPVTAKILDVPDKYDRIYYPAAIS